MAINYFESSNRYTDPVRYFKANDPYYYEVDNIPVKQLEENSKFLKDQVDGLLREQGREFLSDNTRGLDRIRFNELKPTVDGTDSKLRVLPGRYTARINDAYSKDPLQFITQVFTGDFVDDTSKYNVGTAKNTDVAAALDKWQDRLSSNATLMNGLFERVFVYGMKDIYTASEGVDSNDPNNVREPSTFGSQQTFWPGFIGMINEFAGQTDSEGFYSILRSNFTGITTEENFRITGRLESEFIKKWRGVARTSIVDVSETLEIEIPSFDSEDFFYFDENDNKQTVTANQRIDLVFIYSKAIDQSETSLPSYTNGSPRTITKPTLGILKGAGVGVRKFQDAGVPGSTNPQSRVDLQSIDGVTLMIPNSSDELAENTGFATSAGSVVRGSFPSPDDLMNLAPLLAETLSTTSVALIGQSILPVAYVVVKNDASFNSVGDAVITDNDIIDIRPFFRTTELAYNERAGIAAATPQISIANPVVSEAHLDFVKKDIKDGVDSVVQNRINPLQTIINNLKVNKVFTRNKPIEVTGITSKKITSFSDSVYTEFDITNAFGGAVNSVANPYSLKGVYFTAIIDQGMPGPRVAGQSAAGGGRTRTDTDIFDLRISHTNERSLQAAGHSRVLLTAGGSVESGKMSNTFMNSMLCPVRVTTDGRVFIYLLPERLQFNHSNGNENLFVTLLITGWVYEPNSSDITYEIPNGAM
mgnify:CR=1 FL=1|tara:strand:+ start:3808 stop:5910 length:2103 start_codon:yes stop_codon:yes gene_type:complete